MVYEILMQVIDTILLSTLWMVDNILLIVFLFVTVMIIHIISVIIKLMKDLGLTPNEKMTKTISKTILIRLLLSALLLLEIFLGFEVIKILVPEQFQIVGFVFAFFMLWYGTKLILWVTSKNEN